MRFAEIIEDRDIGNLPGRGPDNRPHVGDSRVWTGVGGVIAKQAKRLKHINDDLNDVDFNNIIAKSEDDDDKLSEPLRQLGNELATLNQLTGHRYNAST